jgi:hypothetical protein
MYNDDILICLQRIGVVFPNAFINTKNELILEPKNNVYFSLGDVETSLDFNCKMIAWVSRPACKGTSPYWQKKITYALNEFLGTKFSNQDLMLIYTKLGNDIKRSLCEKFVSSGYDLSMLREGEA